MRTRGNLTARHDAVVVEIVREKEQVGNFSVTGTGKEKFRRGVVVMFGDKITDLKKGDVAFFERRVGTEFNMNGKTYIHLRDIDVRMVDEVEPNEKEG